MSVLISVAMTALFTYPVFLLAGWVSRPAASPIRVHFNQLNIRRF